MPVRKIRCFTEHSCLCDVTISGQAKFGVTEKARYLFSQCQNDRGGIFFSFRNIFSSNKLSFLSTETAVFCFELLDLDQILNKIKNRFKKKLLKFFA